MKKKITFIILLSILLKMSAQEKETLVLLETKEGNLTIKLYNETPLHRDNFLKLVKEGFYNDLLFHRVIKDFMVQGGDPDSRNASDSAMLGGGSPNYTVPAEFRLPQFYHKRGALAAARMGDDMNPEKASSSSQFYIVTGQRFTPDALMAQEKQRAERLKGDIFKTLQAANNDTVKSLYKEGNREALTAFRNKLIEQAEVEAADRIGETKFTAEQKEVYQSLGGTPFLDGGYTVFGEVIEGLGVLDKLESVPTKRGDRPIENVRMKITVIEP